MKRALLVGGGGFCLLHVVAVAALVVAGVPQTASGMAAHSVCSGVYLAGREARSVLEEDVLPASVFLRPLGITWDAAAQAVTARFAGTFERRAQYLAERGCVLDVDASTALPVAAPQRARAVPWPEGDLPSPRGEWDDAVDVERLARLIDASFADAGDPGSANARGIAVVHRGRLLVNRQAPGFGAGTPLHGWSMAKTVLGMLAHKLAAEQRLALDANVVDAFGAKRAPAWVDAWRGDARSRITVADLLYMRDGLDDDESYLPWGNVVRMLWSRPDAAAYAAEAHAGVPPRKRWHYSSGSANILAAVLRGRFESDAAYWAYPKAALFDPIGAHSATFETDAEGTWIGSSYLWASTADWARIGQLMLDDGRWRGREVLAPGWLARAMTASLDAGPGLGYGAHIWRVGHPTEGACRRHALPEDALALTGHWGQIMAIVPSRHAVIVRLGWTFDASRFDGCAFVADVLRALGERH